MPTQQASSAASVNGAPLTLLLTLLFMVVLAVYTPAPVPSPVEEHEKLYRRGVSLPSALVSHVESQGIVHL